MTDTWRDDNCAAMKAHYAVYSVPHAAALWCGVPEDTIKQILDEVAQLSPSGFGRGVWIHPLVPCLEPRSRAITEAIESGSLLHGREDAQPVEDSDHVSPHRRHIFGRDLKSWMEKAFPNEKPSFLFDDIEKNSHSAITADSYRSLKADRDALQKRVDKAVDEFKILRQEKETIELERDALRAMQDKLPPENEHNDDSVFLNSTYWNGLSKLASQAVNDYPNWKSTQKRIQKTGNLQDWLTNDIQADNREAEIIKKILSDFFQELR